MSKKALTDTLQAIEDETEGEKISFGDIVEALNHRGFGTLLIAPALIGVLPTGAIPLMPNVITLFVILIASQILLGRTYPWMPKRLKSFSFDRETFKKSVKKAKPYTEWIDGFFHPRLKFLTGDLAQRVVAFFCIFLAISISILGFVPFAAAIPCFAILMFGLGLTVHDGLLTGIGFLIMGVSFAAIPFLWNALPF